MVAVPDGELLGRLLAGRVTNLRRLSGGASRQTWSFDLVTDSGVRRELVLQIERPERVTGCGMAAEAALLRAAEHATVPVATPMAAGDDDGLGSPWLVLERVDGETIPRKLLSDPALAQARSRLAAQCGRALAAIHSIPLDAAPGLDDGDPLLQFRLLLDALGQPRPALELGLRRLAATRPVTTRTTVVHGDFRTGNLVVGPTGLRAVLDWELAHVGDPLEDLGWLCVRAWRFGSPLRAGGLGSLDEVLTAYEQASGISVDSEDVAWWEAFGTLRWGVMCMVQAATHRSGASRSVELAAIGRRTCENEWDLLRLLGVPAPDQTPLTRAGLAMTPSPSAPFGYPTATELVEAVREFLEDQVMDATVGYTRFHARVAARALALVERELAAGSIPAQAHAARLAGLGYADDPALAAAIRAGECDRRWDDVAGVVLASVHDQLAVANPRHLEPDG